MSGGITCLVACGANQGDCESALNEARDRLAALPEIQSLKASRWWVTEAVGGPAGQGQFLNGAVAFETTLSPSGLHQQMLSIEQQLGRTRSTRWGPRSIDLDLLLYGNVRVQQEQLVIPHPRMTFRRFVLAPAAEVAPRLVEPISGATIAELLNCLDQRAPWVSLEAFPATVWGSDVEVPDATWLMNLRERLNEGATSSEAIEFATPPEVGASRIEIWIADLDRRTDGEAERTLFTAGDWPASLRNRGFRPMLRVACPGGEPPQHIVDRDEGSDRQPALATQGPYLDLRHTDADQAAVELRAALEAMK